MGKNGVEMPGPQHLSAGQFRADGRCQVMKAVRLFGVRLVMDPEHAGPFGPDQRLRRGHISGDHEIFDQPLRLALAPLRDLNRQARIVKQHTPFLQVQCQRLAILTRAVQRLPGAEQALQDLGSCADVFGTDGPFMPGLHLVVSQTRRRTDQRAMKDRIKHPAGPVERHFHHHRRPRFVRPKRAEIVRQRLRQHRYNPVGKIDRVAAPTRFAIQCGFGPDIMGDIRDRDHDGPAAALNGGGKNGIVEIACIGAVNGNERHLAKIPPAAGGWDFHALRLGYRIFGKDVWDIELGKCQGAEGPGGVGRSQIVDDSCCFPDIAAARQKFGLDEITFIRGNVAVLLKHDGVAPAAFGLLKHEAATARCHNTEQAPWC